MFSSGKNSRSTGSLISSCLNMGSSKQTQSSSSLLPNHKSSPFQDADDEDHPKLRACCIPSTIFRPWLWSLLILRRSCGIDSKANLRDASSSSSPSSSLWGIVVTRLMSEVHCRRRKVVRGIRQNSKINNRIDFSYDECSYAKNFDMGLENWLKNDPGFKIPHQIPRPCLNSSSYPS